VPTQYYVAGLLERGIRVLIYAGTYGWRDNWVANARWVDKLEWSGRAEYAAQGWRDWTVEGRKVGETKSAAAGRLTFATVRGAGHMGERHVPCRYWWQPAAATRSAETLRDLAWPERNERDG
jgi:carboxypeptidase C (cathepsin A)